MELSLGLAIDIQDGISHPAAKPVDGVKFYDQIWISKTVSHIRRRSRWMELSLGSAIDIQDGISHPAAKPQLGRDVKRLDERRSGPVSHAIFLDLA